MSKRRTKQRRSARRRIDLYKSSAKEELIKKLDSMAPLKTSMLAVARPVADPQVEEHNRRLNKAYYDVTPKGPLKKASDA